MSQTFFIHPDDYDMIVRMHENPEPPTPAAVRAAKLHRELVVRLNPAPAGTSAAQQA